MLTGPALPPLLTDGHISRVGQQRLCRSTNGPMKDSRKRRQSETAPRATPDASPDESHRPGLASESAGGYDFHHIRAPSPLTHVKAPASIPRPVRHRLRRARSSHPHVPAPRRRNSHRPGVMDPGTSAHQRRLNTRDGSVCRRSELNQHLGQSGRLPGLRPTTTANSGAQVWKLAYASGIAPEYGLRALQSAKTASRTGPGRLLPRADDRPAARPLRGGGPARGRRGRACAVAQEEASQETARIAFDRVLVRRVREAARLGWRHWGPVAWKGVM